MRRKKYDPYLLILPAILFVVVIYFYPVYRVIKDSFYRLDGAERTFIGWDNYRLILFKDEVFHTALFNNLKLLLAVPILLILALGLAYFLYSQIKGWEMFRFIYILPYILSITAVAITFDYILRANGLLNSILSLMHMGGLARNWLGDAAVAIYSIVAIQL